MIGFSRRILLPGLAALALVAGGAGCNRVGQDSTVSEAVIRVTAVTYDGVKASETTKDVVATITFTVFDRTGQGGAVFNSVTFSDFTVTFMAPFAGFSGSGIPDSVSYPLGSSGNKLLLDLVPAGLKPAAGSVLFAQVHFNGDDLIGRHVEFDANLSFSITP